MIHEQADDRAGFFWDAVAGRVQPPPAAHLLGWQMEEYDATTSTIRISFEAGHQFTNPMGVVQGGFLAAMLDDTLGPALMAELAAGEFAPTLELKVSFLRAARPGRLIGTGRVVHRGGTIAFLDGTLRDSDDVLLATATATARIIRI